MTDILLEQTGDFTKFLISLQDVKDWKKEVVILLGKHKLPLTPQGLRQLDTLALKEIKKSKHYELVEEEKGPFLNTGKFIVKTRFSKLVHPTDQANNLAWDMEAQLIYNSENKGTKYFSDYKNFVEFLRIFEDSDFPTVLCKDLTQPLGKDDVYALADAYNSIVTREGAFSSKAWEARSSLLNKQSKYRTGDKDNGFIPSDHHPITICEAYALFVKTKNNPTFTMSFHTFVQTEEYDKWGDGVPPSFVSLYDPSIVKLFK